MFQFSSFFGAHTGALFLVWGLYRLLFNRTWSSDGLAHIMVFVYSSRVMSLPVFEAVFFFWVLFGFFWVCGLCDGYKKHRVLLVSVALHMNWVALADIHFMLPGGHGHERGSTISQWEMGWEVKDSGWLLGLSGIVHEDRLGIVRFVRHKLQYIDRHCVTTLNCNRKNT